MLYYIDLDLYRYLFRLALGCEEQNPKDDHSFWEEDFRFDETTKSRFKGIKALLYIFNKAADEATLVEEKVAT